MRVALFFLGVFLGAGATALTINLVHSHNAPRRRLFVADSFYDPGKGTHPVLQGAFDHTDDIHQTCPQVAFVSTKEQSDYSLLMQWEKDHWWAILDGDDQLLLNERSQDFNKIVRDACEAIRKNEDWPTRPIRIAEKKNVLVDRYELHDLRNGNVATSALIDKQTGKVWVWSTTNKGRSAFMAEDVLPEPEVQ